MSESEARGIVLALHPCAYVMHVTETCRQIRAPQPAPAAGIAGRSIALGGIEPSEAAAWVSAAKRVLGWRAGA